MADARHPIEITLVEGPLTAPLSLAAAGAGAVLTFDGIVRPVEDGRELAALLYEAYEPMTHRELRRLAERIVREHGLSALAMAHSVGRVPVGACSFRLAVAAPHRAEALRAVASFIDLMKREIPLWKVPEWA